jgi:hypothetical protein
MMAVDGQCNTTTGSQIKASEEAFLKSRTAVQSATVAVNCTQFQARRRRSLLGTRATYAVSISCTGEGW